MAALAVLLAAFVSAMALLIWNELRTWRREAAMEHLLVTFGPAVARAPGDPRQIVLWQPVIAAERRLFPAAFSELERAMGGRFPFSAELIEGAHARWTAEWLAWEQTHDADYKLKAAEAEEQIRDRGQDSAIARARLDVIEREKLERYQQRYEEYVRTAKALAGLIDT
ncbi:MAG: hypothetical protein HYX76_04200 [Acidobacteria bacterium]|nr:hypothetical protein [Acidobacteriota bacterium]